VINYYSIYHIVNWRTSKNFIAGVFWFIAGVFWSQDFDWDLAINRIKAMGIGKKAPILEVMRT
jgi:hypothetical protein